jgi:NDP-4-keto-2,6-dideoxyhexose 3-C-methyltransferase
VQQAQAALMDFLAQQKAQGSHGVRHGRVDQGQCAAAVLGHRPPTCWPALPRSTPTNLAATHPGSLIPIRAQQDVLASNPDYLLVLPWHFRNFFLNNPALKGRKLVFPLPVF